MFGDFGRGDVGVDVQTVAPAVVDDRVRRDDRNDAAVAVFADFVDVDAGNFADPTEVDFGSVGVELRRFAPVKDVRVEAVGERDGGTAVKFDRVDETFRNFMRQFFANDGQRRVVGVTSALDEARFDTGVFHRLTDRGAASVNDDRFDSDRLHKDEVGEEVHHRDFVFHQAAAEFDDDGGAAVFADPFHRFDKNVGFAANFFDRVEGNGVGARLFGHSADSCAGARDWDETLKSDSQKRDGRRTSKRGANKLGGVAARRKPSRD